LLKKFNFVFFVFMRISPENVYNRIIESGGHFLSELKLEQPILATEPELVPAFGYELLREVLLPEILGRETASILYWAGKGLARKYPLQSIEDMITFFHQSGWGTLQLKSEKKDELEFELSSPLIADRFKVHPDCHFQLEAGFLAQQIEQQKQVITEAYEHPKKRLSIVSFTVRWDRKDTMK
jgi:predicted hydrocarbon binding protein